MRSLSRASGCTMCDGRLCGATGRGGRARSKIRTSGAREQPPQDCQRGAADRSRGAGRRTLARGGCCSVQGIEVDRLILRDQQGVVRAELPIAPGFGEVSFSLNDRNGRPLVGMGGVDGTAIISMLDSTGKQRAFMRVGPDALGNDHGPTITMYDAADNRLWCAP